MKYTFTLVLLLSILMMPKAQYSFTEKIEAHRTQYKADFLSNDHSPLKKQELEFLRFYEAKENYQVMATFSATPDAKPFELATYSGKKKDYVQYGWLNFELNGTPVKMAVYQSLRLRRMPMYKDYLFLPFKDDTNGDDTYGGGRYIDLDKKSIIDGQVSVDFNKAYNPYCAYSDGYNCPIPPRENHLELAIEAGEKMYVGKKLQRPTTTPAPIVKEVFIPATAEKIWSMWTSNEGLQSWLVEDSQIDFKIGGTYEFYFAPDAPEGQRGGEGNTVLSYIPKQMLSFSWIAPPSIPTIRAMGAKMWIVLELDSTPTGTLVRLTNQGFGKGEDWQKTHAYFDSAWTSVLTLLAEKAIE